jgi:hypothetical protein
MTRKDSKLDSEAAAKWLPVELKRLPTAEGVFTAYAATWDQDLSGETIARGAFEKSLRQHTPKLLWSHDRTKPIGRLLSAREDDTGLLIEAQLNLDTLAGKEAYASLKAGDVDVMSIGYITRKRQGNLLQELTLLEVSVVTLPANTRAKVVSVKSLDSKRDLREALKGLGLSRTAAEKAADLAWPAIGEAEDEAPGCHFCGKAQGEVPLLLQKHSKLICGACAQQVGAAAKRYSIDLKAISARLDRVVLAKKG